MKKRRAIEREIRRRGKRGKLSYITLLTYILSKRSLERKG